MLSQGPGQQRHGNIQAGEIVQGENRFEVQGSAALPEDTDEFGRSPANLAVRANALDLKAVTAGVAHKFSGAASLEGKLTISNATLSAELQISGGPMQFEGGSVQKFSGKATVLRSMPSLESNKPWYTGLRSNLIFDASDVRFKDRAVDSAHGEMFSKEELVTVETLQVKRVNDDFVMHGHYRLPATWLIQESNPPTSTCR